MKREAWLLRERALDSLLLAVENFNQRKGDREYQEEIRLWKSNLLAAWRRKGRQWR